MRICMLFSLAPTFSYAFRPATAAASLSAIALSTVHKSVATSLPNTTTRLMGTSSDSDKVPLDPEYPGTAVERMLNIRKRVQELSQGDDLNQSWQEVRRKILWAGGLKDLPNAVPGKGYTGHSFNDFNHVDLTAMIPVDSQNNGEIQGIARGNFLGDGIRIASLPELGPGGSWSTCALGCNKDPPQDVAHVQFQSRIASHSFA